MPIPLVLPAAAVAIAFLMSQSKGSGSDTRTDPNTLFDDNLPPDVRRSLETTLVDASVAWPGLFMVAFQMQSQGYPKTAQTVLAVCNAKRQQAGLAPLAYPISYETYAQVAAESQSAPFKGTNWQGIDQTAVPGPGGPINGVPPGASQVAQTVIQQVLPGAYVRPPEPAFTTTTTRPDPVTVGPGMVATMPPKPTGGTPGFVPPTSPPPGGRPPLGGNFQPPAGSVVTPQPGGGATITVPGLGTIVVPPGIMGAPPTAQPPAGYQPPRTTPPAGPAKKYPTGTHTRPDGTYGYTTQEGDYATTVIAKKFGGSNQDLISANPNTDWKKNYKGTDLNIPAGWVSDASPPPAGNRGPNPPKVSASKPQSPGAAAVTTVPLPPGIMSLPPDEPNMSEEGPYASSGWMLVEIVEFQLNP